MAVAGIASPVIEGGQGMLVYEWDGLEKRMRFNGKSIAM